MTVLMILLFLYNVIWLREEFPIDGTSMYIKRISDLLLPILSTMAFIPIVNTLIEVNI